MDETLKALANTFSKLPSREEFATAFKGAMDVIVSALSSMNKKIDERLSQIQNGKDGLQGVQGEKGDKGDKGPKGDTFIALRGERGQDGTNGKDGSPDSPIQVRDKLESLEGDARIDKSAVKGIEQIEENIKQIELRPVSVGGAKGIGLYVGGTKKLLTAQSINLVAGTNVTITYAYVNGRNDITISSSGGGGGSMTALAATGTVDDSNTVFTFASTPTLVVVNGNAYRNGHGVTIVTTTATLDSPVGGGGDIYGLS